MKRAILFVMVLFCLGCSHQPKKINIAVALSDSNRSLQISGFDKAVIADIGRDTSDTVWQSLLSVYKMPVDTDMRDYQNEQPGKYSVRDSLVIFTPDTAFKKDQAYFVRYYQYDTNPDALHFIRDKKRPGDLSYTDLVFKY